MKLKGRFVKSANPDGSRNDEQSFWEVWGCNESSLQEEKLLTKLTVADLQYLNLSYQDIATKKFGQLLLTRTRKHLDNATDNAAPSWDLTQ